MAVVTRLGKGAGTTAGTTTASWASFNILVSDQSTVAIVFVNASVTSNAVATCSVTYGGTAMKQLGWTAGGATTARSGVGIYYLFNPGTGSQTVVATPAGATIAGTHGIDVAFSGVSSIGMAQNVATMAHTVTSVANGYALRVISNGVTAGTLNQTTEISGGTVDAGVGDFIAVQSAVGAAPSVAFTATGTATTPLSMGCVVNPVGQMNYVQSGSSPSATTLTAAVLLPGPSFIGDTIVAAFSTNAFSTSVLTGVTDTKGNTYVVGCPASTTGTSRSWVYYAPVLTAADAGTNTVTVTFTTTAPGNLELIAVEYDGMHPTSPLDQHKEANASSGTAMDSGASPATSQANEMVFGYGACITGSATAAGAGFTGRIVGTDAAQSLVEDKIVTSIGTQNATGTMSISGTWLMSCATFKARTASVVNNLLSVAVRRAGFY